MTRPPFRLMAGVIPEAARRHLDEPVRMPVVSKDDRRIHSKLRKDLIEDHAERQVEVHAGEDGDVNCAEGRQSVHLPVHICLRSFALDDSAELRAEVYHHLQNAGIRTLLVFRIKLEHGDGFVPYADRESERRQARCGRPRQAG